MRVSRQLSMAAAMGFSLCCLSIAGAASSAIQTSDEFIAERALGPQWQKVSRHSGMIFTATVLASTTPTTAKQIPKLQPTPIDHLAPAQIEIRFRRRQARSDRHRSRMVRRVVTPSAVCSRPAPPALFISAWSLGVHQPRRRLARPSPSRHNRKDCIRPNRIRTGSLPNPIAAPRTIRRCQSR